MYSFFFFCSEKKNPNKLPPYIFLIWQDNLVWIICMLGKKKYVFWKIKRCGVPQRVIGHMMAFSGSPAWGGGHTEVKTGGCKYPFSLFIYFFFSPAILYAVIQAIVGFFLVVNFLLSCTTWKHSSCRLKKELRFIICNQSNINLRKFSFIDKIDHGAFWFEDGTTHMQGVKSQTEM